MTKEQATKMIADAQAEYSADRARVARINRLHNEGGEGYQIEADSSKLDAVYAAVAAAGYYVGVGRLITKDEHIAAKADQVSARVWLCGRRCPKARKRVFWDITTTPRKGAKQQEDAMKKIINGKRFDTGKSIEIGEASATGYSRSDFGWWQESLYKTPRSGTFFLAGSGGPMTHWSRPVGNNGTSGGEGIKVLDKDQALEWCERHLEAKDFEEFFNEEIQDA